jgi:hypothetical protein
VKDMFEGCVGDKKNVRPEQCANLDNNPNSAGSIRTLRNPSLIGIRTPPDRPGHYVTALLSRIARRTTKDGLNLTPEGRCRDPLRFAPRTRILTTPFDIPSSETFPTVPTHSREFRRRLSTIPDIRYSRNPGVTSSDWSDRCPDLGDDSPVDSPRDRATSKHD